MARPSVPAPGGRPSNRLAAETSPYLLQHAHNPVDWHPWGPEALALAKRVDKPVFLSIGYSTCHWCHVMERESFEDDEVARLMNDTFVCVKVDREERPDVDAVYMTACQMMTGSGGWPLTIIMTPDGRPFFAATYIPKAARWGRAGMLELVPEVRRLWRDERARLLSASGEIAQALAAHDAGAPGGVLRRADIEMAYTQLSQAYDGRAGGFGRAPKFPTPHQLTFLLRDHQRTGDRAALEMAVHTLDAMRRGGLFDHVGHGFHRYSTDREWLLPHFEKMLYDQALLMLAYTEGHLATGRADLRRTVLEVAEYVLRDLRAPGGAFFSAEDADSEGEEGRFYLWTMEALRDALGPDDAAFVASHLGAAADGNFADEATGHRTGANILHLPKPLPEDARPRWEAARRRLLEARGRRVRPGRDEKVLADWNGLMIAALARAGSSLGEPDLVEAAKRAMEAVERGLRTPEGRLLHATRGSKPGVPGFLDDHAFLAWARLELYEATLDPAHLVAAQALAHEVLERFADPDSGGFFLTAHDAERLLVRHKERHDGALPAGASVATDVLVRLSLLTGDVRLEKEAERALRAMAARVAASPAGFTHLLQAADLAIGPSREIVVAGRKGAPDTAALVDAVRRRPAGARVLLFRDVDSPSDPVARLAPFSAGMGLVDGKAAAYVCRDHACDRPVTRPEDLVASLSRRL